MLAEFITPDDRRWSDFLQRVWHDYYHLPEYVRFAGRHEGGVPVAFYAEEGRQACLIPLLLRPLPCGLDKGRWRDACSPYGYSSPLFTATKNGNGAWGRFLEAFRDLSREWRIVTAFLRFHPLLEFPTVCLGKAGEIVTHGQTVVIDLTLPNQEIWRQTRNNHRCHINRLLRMGYQATINEWKYYEAFKAIYWQTMERVGAKKFYFFSNSYFDELHAALEQTVNLCVILAPDGAVAAAGLFTSCNGIVEFHLAGSADKYLEDAPSKLLIDFVRRWGKEKGATIFHLGGGVGGRDDQLFYFKAGFSRERRAFCTYRMVVDHRKYLDLLQTVHCVNATCSKEGDLFFPFYRRGDGRGEQSAG